MPIVRLLAPGSLSNFARDAGGNPYGLNWKNKTSVPLVFRPPEMIAGSAIGFSCSLTGLEEVLESFLIPAGLLGVNSILQIEPLWTYTNNANNKILSVRIGEIPIYSATRTTSATEAPLIVLMNRNSAKSQIAPYGSNGNYMTAGTVTPQTYTIDFSKNQVVFITGRRASSGDTIKLEYYRALHYIGF